MIGGLIYYKEEDFDKLISVSIEMARMTHNAVNGYLGAFYTALFVSYAMRGIEIEKWPFMLMKLYKDKVIENYIKKIGRDVEEYFRYAHNFYSKWDAYIKDKFDEYGNVINLRTTINLSWRSKYYESIQNVINPDTFTTAGSGGDDCLIIAYDSLIDAGDKWETLVFYAMLHTGDTDTTGCVAGGLYGVLYGMRDIPKINYKFLEHRDYIIRLAEKLYLKYN